MGERERFIFSAQLFTVNMAMGRLHNKKKRDFDDLGEGDLPRDGDHPMNGDHHRGGDHPRDSGCLKDFYHPKGWLLNFGSVES